MSFELGCGGVRVCERGALIVYVGLSFVGWILGGGFEN